MTRFALKTYTAQTGKSELKRYSEQMKNKRLLKIFSDKLYQLLIMIVIIASGVSISNNM